MKRMIHFPRIRLWELVREFGGVNRDDAIAGAQTELESMRGQADQAIGAGIAALEEIVAAPEDATGYSDGQMVRILACCDQIVTLAGTFGYTALDSATRCLCDLADGLRQAGAADVPAIQVHARTMRLLAPGAPPLPAEHQDRVLTELAKILTHHGFTRAGDAADSAQVRQ